MHPDRADRNLDGVDRHRCLRRMAVAQARRMANRQEILHQDLVADAVTQHRVNVLSPVFRRVGVGARRGDDGTWYVSQLLGKKA